MIKKIIINWFGSYKKEEFKFSPGVNIILGESDDGKSSFVRAVKWCFRNRPSGDSFRSWYANKKSNVSVKAILEDKKFVSRVKGPKKNIYRTSNTKDDLSAIGSDVPKEVLSISGMKDLNIQMQHPDDQYFLLNKSPGQVAKEFNKVTGIEIIDKIFTKINKLFRATNAELKVVDKEITKKEKQLEELKWVQKAFKEAKKIRMIEKELSVYESKASTIEKVLGDIQRVKRKRKKELSGIRGADVKLNKLIKIKSRMLNYDQDMVELQDLTNSTKKVTQDIKAYKDVDSAIKSLKKLQELDNNHIDNEIMELDSVIHNCVVTEYDVNEYETDIKELQTKLDKALDNKACPLCGRN